MYEWCQVNSFDTFHDKDMNSNTITTTTLVVEVVMMVLLLLPLLTTTITTVSKHIVSCEVLVNF